jgi:hypothetical protein
MVQPMQSYEQLVELAKLCANQSRVSFSKETAAELWRMAKEYQAEAAKLNGDKSPEIGKPPRWIRAREDGEIERSDELT